MGGTTATELVAPSDVGGDASAEVPYRELQARCGRDKLPRHIYKHPHEEFKDTGTRFDLCERIADAVGGATTSQERVKLLERLAKVTDQSGHGPVSACLNLARFVRGAAPAQHDALWRKVGEKLAERAASP